MTDLNDETKKFLNDPEEELERQGEDIRDIQGRLKDVEEKLDAWEKLFVGPLEDLIKKK